MQSTTRPPSSSCWLVVLRDAGYRVLTAESADEGFKTAQREMPDLIVSDVMREMDGIKLCRIIRGDDKLNSVPILLISTLHKGETNIVKGLKVGADDYLEAPYAPLNLAARAARLIERKRTQDILRESENRFRSLIESEERFRTQYKRIPIPTTTWRKIGDDFTLIVFFR